MSDDMKQIAEERVLLGIVIKDFKVSCNTISAFQNFMPKRIGGLL
jgi:hypothetical protein